MKQVNLKSIISQKLGKNYYKYSYLINRPIIALLEKLIKINKINKFLRDHEDKQGFDLIGQLFEELDFSYYVSSKDKLKIPADGKLVIVANHPLGALDGLALLKAIGDVRPDVKIVANDILLEIENIAGLLLPYDIFSFKAQKNQISMIEEALNREKAVIFFPAAEVSRLKINGIKDKKWQKGAVKFASKFHAPVLPVFIRGYNSALFYIASMLLKKLSMFLLPREIFNKSGKSIVLKIGGLIPAAAFKSGIISPDFQNKLLRKHLYRLDKNKKPVFVTEETVIHPVDKKTLKSELYREQLLGVTRDRKAIFLADGEKSQNVLKEISRLREITFRKVGEGTGKKSDSDKFDNHYKHIVLWDDVNLEIAGAYRLGLSPEILQMHGINGFYNTQHFTLTENFYPLLIDSVELGRSFIQSNYWKTNALDYLWQGIGAFLMENRDIRYLWGAVSISDSYSELAKAYIVHYYKKWYSSEDQFGFAKTKYAIPKNYESEVSLTLNGNDYQEDFRILKTTLKNLGFSVPVLFRKYTELCEYGGVSFIDFNIDKDFSNTVDGLILLDLSMLKHEQRERFFGQKCFVETSPLVKAND